MNIGFSSDEQINIPEIKCSPVTPTTPLIGDSPVSLTPASSYPIVYFSGDFPTVSNHSPTDTPYLDKKSETDDICAGTYVNKMAMNEQSTRIIDKESPGDIHVSVVPSDITSQESVPLIEMTRQSDHKIAVNNKYVAVRLVQPESLTEIMLADGHQKEIEQLKDPDYKPIKTCANLHYCVVFWSIFGHVGFIISCILCAWNVHVRQGLTTKMDYYQTNERWIICSGVIVAVSYLIVCVEGLVSNTFTYLDTYMSVEEFNEHVDTLRNSAPIIKWYVECYHFEGDEITLQNKNNSSSRFQDFLKLFKGKAPKIITFRHEENFKFRYCTDAAGKIDGFKNGCVTRVDINRTFGFLNRHTIDEFIRKKQELHDKNKHKDKYLDIREEFKIEGMKECIIIFPLEERHWLMKRRYYLATLCIFLTWPYRIWFRKRINKKRYTYVKLISV